MIHNEEFLKKQGEDKNFKGLSNIWNEKAINYRYAYNFEWLGVPIIQVPQDIYAIQELIWKVNPDLIIETGIAHGGSLIMSASMLLILDYRHYKQYKCDRKVIGVDIEIRQHTKENINNHPLSDLIMMFECSSTDSIMTKRIEYLLETKSHEKVMVFLDSNHSHEHVFQELTFYAPFVSKGSYIVVWDSGIEELPDYMLENNNKPWKKGNNPKTAIHEFLKTEMGKNFEIDKELENKLMITSTSDGFLRRIK